ncbi:putative disease resistance RPP13-like protein 1 [Morella rubra]|uniref:Putative disease resistance RPP13-like protein 1 n=1 Tax=Morella rubra TaxID=262757 RepID=A0A6A1WHM6_9ROSI|nr:putative disease resistance RPP13-like protein 1 [Morella rubra]
MAEALRDENKEAIIDLLLSDDTNGKNISVIAVVGMGGIGKTTLAQLVYNDERVREHFDVEAWVCVSEEFDLFKITKSILDAVPPSDNKDLNWLQVKLREGRKLQELGRQIVEKCKGLPLAIKTIGALLRSKLGIEEWDRILRSELWDLPVDETNILPALRLSYKYLPSPLKHCFAYCLIFPKDCILRKDEVILLWMAEGFLQQSNNKTMGEVGEEYFCALVSRSLFQQSACHHLGQLPSLQDLSIVGFDGVVVVGSEFYGNDSPSIKPSGALRSLTFERMLNWEKWFLFGKNEGGAFPNLASLYISDCPKLTGGLPINLPSLATLRISKCPQLVASLPRAPAMLNVGLTHCNGVQLKELPSGMQKLTMEGFDALESLPEEIVGYNSYLQKLIIKNCSSLVSFTFPRGGLHSSLEKLELIDCDSLKSVSLGFLPKLYKILIQGCRNLESITVPEQHEDDGTMNFNSCLQELRIKGCSSLVSLPRGGLRSALKILEIEDCMKLELPTPLDYSFLERLQLYKCDSIRSVPLDLLSSLSRISIIGCTNLESLTVSEQNLRDLMTSTIWISDCPNFVSFPKKMQMLLPSLQYLSINNCAKVESFSEGGLPSNLESLFIVRCDELVANRMGCGL